MASSVLGTRRRDSSSVANAFLSDAHINAVIGHYDLGPIKESDLDQQASKT